MTSSRNVGKVRTEHVLFIFPASGIFTSLTVRVLQSNHCVFVAGKSFRLTVCGGKNVGKSTFARYLVNSMLNVYA